MRRDSSGQRIKTLGRRLLPPVLVDLLRPGRHDADGPGFRGQFERYEDALRAGGNRDYQSDEIIKATVERTKQIRDAVSARPTFALNSWTLQNLAAFGVGVSTLRRAPLRVLDFGGAMGVHYFTLRPFLGGSSGLDWTVCETEATARSGQQYFADGHLKFTSALQEVKPPFDVVLASGALQYLESPADILDRLATASDLLVINRIPFAGGSDRLTVQTTPDGARYPAWFFSEQQWLDRLVKRGLSVVMRWSAPDDTITLDGNTVVYQGLVARRGGPSQR